MKRQTLRKVAALLRPRWPLVAGSFLLAALYVALNLYVPVLVGEGVDCAVGPGKTDFLRLAPICAQLVASAALASLLQWLMALCNNRLAYGVSRDLRVRAFAHLQELPLRYIDGHPHGETTSRMANDIDQLSDGLLLGFAQLFTGVLTICGTLAFMARASVGIALVVVCVTPLSLFVASYVARHSFRMFRRQSDARAKMAAFAQERIGGQKVVQAFSQEENSARMFAAINAEFAACNLRATFFSSITNPTTRFVNGLVYAGVGIFGALSVIQGGISVGQLTCFLSYANQYAKPFNEISGVVAELQNAIACAGRVFDLLEEPPQEPDAAHAVTLAKGQARGDVRLDHVYFSYEEDAPLIRDVCISVRPGERVAIVGPTGCGKTTLINLLMRFYEVQGGEIRIGGISHRDITRDSLRASFGMVLQDTWLQTGTIAQNIAYGRPDATQEEIEQAARAAYAHGFISRMPDGYQTVIAQDGGNLSQGQKQLLCIARVMLALPPMLILDEATSSIDARTEGMVQRAFDKMMRGRTSFIVAHRLSTIRAADVILVMKDGRIAERGSHDALLARRGLYMELYKSQWEGQEQ